MLSGFFYTHNASAAWDRVNGGPPLIIDSEDGLSFYVFCQFISLTTCYYFQDDYVWVDVFHHGPVMQGAQPPSPIIEVSKSTHCPYDPPQQ